MTGERRRTAARGVVIAVLVAVTGLMVLGCESSYSSSATWYGSSVDGTEIELLLSDASGKVSGTLQMWTENELGRRTRVAAASLAGERVGENLTMAAMSTGPSATLAVAGRYDDEPPSGGDHLLVAITGLPDNGRVAADLSRFVLPTGATWVE